MRNPEIKLPIISAETTDTTVNKHGLEEHLEDPGCSESSFLTDSVLAGSQSANAGQLSIGAFPFLGISLGEEFEISVALPNSYERDLYYHIDQVYTYSRAGAQSSKEFQLYLDQSLFADPAKISADPLIEEVVNELWARISFNGMHYASANKRSTLNCIITNILTGELCGACVGFHKDRNRYKDYKEYGHGHFSYRAVVECILAGLTRAGFLACKKGSEGAGRSSRYWASGKLLMLFRAVYLRLQKTAGYTVPRQFFSYAEKSKIIVLKDADKSVIDCPSCPQIQEFVNSSQVDLNQINQLIRNSYFSLQLDPQFSINEIKLNLRNIGLALSLNQINSYLQIPRNSQYTNTSNNTPMARHTITQNTFGDASGCPQNSFEPDYSTLQNTLEGNLPTPQYTSEIPIPYHFFILHRVFNNVSDSEISEGGRHYGNFQNLRSELRQGMLIDGFPTVELDYGSLHIAMLYNSIGLETPVLPYGFETHDPLREIAKLMVLIAINGSSRQCAIWELMENVKRRDPVGGTAHLKNILQNSPFSHDNLFRACENIFDHFVNFHQPIVQFFYQQSGTILQFKDSEIARRIMLSFAKDNIVCLPVHDSFIVQVQHEPRLRKQMHQEYKAVYGFDPVVK